MTIDEAQRIVDDTVPADLVWAGTLAPPSSLRSNPTARAHLRTETVVERGAMAVVSVRLRFWHLIHRVRYQRRRDGTWVPMVEPESESDAIEGKEDVVVDVEAPMTDLIEGLWSHHFAVTGATTTREVGEPDDATGLVDLVTHPVNGYLDLRGDPLSGPHGLIRLMVRVRNTTEPLVDLPSRVELAHSMAGCHVIVALDKGKFLAADDPPVFAEPFVATCENENAVQVIVDGSAKILLSAVMATPG